MATPEELAQFEPSGRYVIADLLLEVQRLNDEEFYFTPIIGVTNSYDNTTSNLEMLQEELDGQKIALDVRKEEALIRKDALLESIETISLYAKSWKVERADRGEYFVTGYGLGWLNTSLTDGKWLFATDTRQAAPASTESIDLVNTLIAN